MKLTDGQHTFDVKSTQVTNDLDVVQNVAMVAAQKDAAIAAWQKSQQKAAQTQQQSELARQDQERIRSQVRSTPVSTAKPLDQGAASTGHRIIGIEGPPGKQHYIWGN